MTPVGTRKTAAERREELLEAAVTEFAARGLDGASTDAIARRAGVSQPYLFRLFGTKRDLFILAVERCFADTAARFREAAEGLEGPEALRAMGRAYVRWITTDPRRLRAQMQFYAACDDPEVRTAVRRGYGGLVRVAEDTGASPEEVSDFFARGMLINVIVQMGLDEDGNDPWAGRLVRVCMEPPQ